MILHPLRDYQLSARAARVACCWLPAFPAVCEDSPYLNWTTSWSLEWKTMQT